ncbi:MAG: RDD family protein [Lachnospiraceae bacterium]|nr:RDD family protein [Lachnospiraceae bacterium]
MLELQKGSIWKRISAYLFDVIVISIVAMLFATLLSWVLRYDKTLDEYNAVRGEVEAEYGVSFDIRESEYNTYDEEKKARYDAAYEALNQNQEAVRLYALLINFEFIIITASIILAFLVMEFVLPLILKEGRTLGKKIFGLAVIRPNLVRISGPVLFIRTILGKCVVETLIPVFVILLTAFGKGNIFLVILLFLIPIVNLVLFFATRNHTVLHDLLSVTVVCDYQSQRIFDTEDDLIRFKEEQHAAQVDHSREEHVFDK